MKPPKPEPPRPPPPPPVVSVIVVTFNGKEFTPACLETVPADAETIVVDNGSKDGTADEVAARFPEAVLIRNAVNRGFAAAVNQGMARARGRYFCLLNNDARLAPDTLATMTAWMDAHPDVGMAGPQLLHEDGRKQHSFANLPTLATELLNKSLLRILNPSKYPSKLQEHAEPMDVESVIGACMMVRRDLVERIGPLDQAYFLFLEETDWCLRARRAGSRVVLLPQAKVLHLQGRTRAKMAVRAKIEYTRSLFTFFRKHRPCASPLLRLLYPVKSLLEFVFQSLGAAFSAGARRRWVETAATLAWQAAGAPRSWGLSVAGDPKYVRTAEGVTVSEQHLDVLRELEKGIATAKPTKDLRHKKALSVPVGERTFLVKVYKLNGLGRKLKAALLGSRAARELTVGIALLRRGVPTVPVVAMKDKGDERWVAFEWLKDAAQLQETLLSEATPGRLRRTLLFEYGKFARRVQDAGVWQYDFNPSNVLVRGTELTLIDFERIRVRGGPLGEGERLGLLARMNRISKLTRSDRLRFLKGYVAAYPAEEAKLGALAAELTRLGACQAGRDAARAERRCLDENRDFGAFAIGDARGHYRKRRPESALPGLTEEDLRRALEGGGEFRRVEAADAMAEWRKANRLAKGGGPVPLAVAVRGGGPGGILFFI